MPTRYNEIGLAGRRGSGSGVQPTEQRSAGVLSDPFLRQFVIGLPLVASAAEQTVPDFVMPANAISAVGFLRIKTPSSAGTTPTIAIGALAAGPADLLAAVATTVAGLFGTIQNVDVSGDQITYTLGSADLVGLEAELVLTVLASDD